MTIRNKFFISTVCITLVLLLIYLSNRRRSIYDLGKNYFYLDKLESIDIGYPGGEAIIYKSNQKNVFNNVLLTAYDFEVKYNDKYVIIKQLFKKETQFNFFIIDKNIDSIYGPLNQNSFMNLKAELNVKIDLD